ncbi:MAG: TonB-dependent receptor SusC [SAR116 cluster bacterium]|nr:MAG: TonB-dependent receptor SusC [SAR116 cluster bacterium]
MKKILSVTFMFLCLSVAFAQVTTSNIKGVVSEGEGIPLMGANITAIHTPTGTVYGAISNEDGRYNLLNLRVGGPYEVTVSYVGFSSKVKNDVFLSLGKTFQYDVSLKEDSQVLDEVVIVGDLSGTFGSDRTGAETSVGRRELTTLPTISRSTNDFTRLEPTASSGSFGGRNDQYNNFSLDGAIFNNPFGLDAAQPGGQTNASPISIDAIDQIQVSTAPYDVTQAGFTGASVNAVTKSGTNDFKGTVYGFFRNDDLTGGKINGDKVFKSGLAQQQYGFSVGGPIVKNKLFFFANFEKDNLTELGSNGFVPNTGSGAINESRVSATDLAMVSNLLSQVNIANGQKYNPGVYEGFNFEQASTKGIFKLDWNLNKNHRVALIYNFLTASKEKPAHPSALGFRGPDAATLQFSNAGYTINNNINSIQFEVNSTLSDNMANKFQVGYTHFDDFRDPMSTPAPSLSILDAEGNSNYIIAGHEPFSINNRLDQKVFQLTNNLNIYKGNHTFTLGVSFEKFQFDNSFNLGAYGAQGVFFPTTTITDFPNFAASGALQTAFDDAIAAANALESNGTGNPGGWALAETNVGQLAFYAQDEWNVNEDFKLTYGIRFDKPLYFDTADMVRENIERKGGASGTYIPSISYTDPANNSPVLLDSEQMPTNKFLVSPRVGFNWDVNGDATTQLRGGSGLFTGRFPFVWLGNHVQGVDFFFYQPMDPDYQFPQVWRTNIGLDHRFENGLLLTADLSYTKDTNAAHVQNWGLSAPSGRLNGIDNREVYTNEDKSQIFGGPTNAYVFTNSDKGRVINASFKLSKTFDNGLYTQLAYSYLDAREVNSIEAEITGDAFAGNPVVGNANNDVLGFSKYGDKHRVIGVMSKKLGKATTISSFFEYAQGGRFNYIYGGDINNDGSGINDLIYIPTPSELSQMNFSGAGQAQAFENFIQQDDYLSANRGSYAERYAALSRWRSSWDVKVLHDIKVSGDNVLQLSLDVLNFGNFLNSNWGVVDAPAFNQLLGVQVSDGTPTYTFDKNLQDTFTARTNELSRWRAQIGVRYIFN